MQLSASFDAAVAADHRVEGRCVTIDLRPGQRILHMQLDGDPGPVAIHLLVDDKGDGFVRAQGLIVCAGDGTPVAVPLEQVAEGELRAVFDLPASGARIANRFPYGRDRLDRLVCETAGRGGIAWRWLDDGRRGFPVAVVDAAGTASPLHMVIAGEDAWETAGSWVADGMLRAIAAGAAPPLRLRIVPLVSPYSATRERPSYTAADGRGRYGAATWGDQDPPSEFALLRREVERDIATGNLGLLLTIHSWQAQKAATEMEAIASAGDRTLDADRRAWALRTLATLMRDVPRGRHRLAEEIWFPGLARHYLLARHDLVSFRVEISTVGNGIADFAAIGRRFLQNVASVDDWTLVYGRR